MPMYEYRCTSCGAISEFLVFSGNTDGIACRTCGSTGLEKILSAPNVHMAADSSSCRDRGCQSVPQCGSSCCESGGCCPKAF